jgi:hypothetical protein
MASLRALYEARASQKKVGGAQRRSFLEEE